jgi:NitT/TauT family transport system substrate-binding protein
MTTRWASLMPVALTAAALAACGGAPATPAAPAAPPAATATATAGAPAGLTRVVVATGFQPDVEFAPYYVAQALGYYKEAGLDVTMNYDRDPNLLQDVGSGKFSFAATAGDGMIVAAAAGAPVEYVMAQYQEYPVGAMVLKDGGPELTSPSGLKGLKVGISVPGSSTDFGLEALLQAGGLTDRDITKVAIGFAETEALVSHKVDVAMTYIDNEPVQAAALGHPVNVLPVSRYAHLVSNGVVTSRSMVRDHPEVVQAFVTATLRGLAYTLKNPDQAFAIARKAIPTLVDSKQIDIAREVLTARLQFQQPPAGHPLGWSDPASWAATVDLLKRIGAIRTDPRGELFTNAFVERANITP